MSLKNLNRKHLWLIGLYSARHAIRGGVGLVFILLTLTCGLMTAHIIITPVEQIRIQSAKETGREMPEEEIHTQLLDFARPAVEWVIGGSASSGESPSGKIVSPEEAEKKRLAAEEWAAYLLDEQPALLSAVLLIMLFAAPFLVATGTFNQLSGDVQTKGLRFQLLHAARENLFLGRFLGSALFTVLTMVFLVVIVTVYLGINLDVYGFGTLIGWGLRGCAALLLVCLPYVAFCSWISCAVDSPFGSLTISSVVIGVVPLFALMGGVLWEPATAVNYVLPWGVQNHLLHPAPSHFFGAAAACLGYTAIFLFLGNRHFLKRDL
jgi:hypothetical protein